MNARTFSIAGRLIGEGEPCFVIAEAGVNHDGDVGKAVALVDAAAEAGADAVKFQTFSARRLVAASAPKADYQRQRTPADESQLEMLERLELTADHHHALADHCRRRGILFLSTAFDEESADFLQSLDMPAFKVPSGEITNLPYLKHVARIGRPIILSTGMSTLDEVGAAVSAVREEGAADLAVLQCVSSYPAASGEVNLRAMETMRSAFDVVVGYSDHTLGIDVTLAAVAIGAHIVEKHLTLDCSSAGPDHAASIEPNQFGALVRGIRTVESSLGTGVKAPTRRELDTAAVARKSVVAVRGLDAGALITGDAVAIKRPGTGAPPSMLGRIVGRRAAVSIAAGTPIDLDMVR